MTADATANAAAAFATAAASAAAGGLCAATGVGLPAGAAAEAVAIGAVIDGAVCTVVAVISTRAAIKSRGYLEASINHKNNLPAQNAGNFRENLRNLAGDPPSNMVDPQAHHVLPQKFRNFFKSLGINIDQPKYGSWVSESIHQGFTNSYNLDWQTFINDSSIQKTLSTIEEFARMMGQKYGFTIHF